MSECGVKDCGQPSPDGSYCAQCHEALQAALGDIPALLAELDPVRAKQTRYGERIGVKTKTRPLPVDLRVTEAEHDLTIILRSWADELWRTPPDLKIQKAESRFHRIPEQPKRRPFIEPPPGNGAQELATWLLARVDALRIHPYGFRAVEAITAAVARLERLLDRPDPGWFAGPCDECREDLYAPTEARIVTCQTCGAEYRMAERRRWLLDSVRETLATATEISRALTNLDRPVTPERIRKWKQRGRLVVKGVSLRGEPTYLVGDVLDLLAESSRSRAKVV